MRKSTIAAADRWPGVIARMKRHMRSSRMPGLNDGQTGQIETFLQQHKIFRRQSGTADSAGEG